MRKLFHRPAVALASVLALIFVIILIIAYCKIIDDLTTSLSQTEIDVKSESNYASEIERLPKLSIDVIGPQLPIPTSSTTKIPNRRITLGIFEALDGTCFLRDGEKYDSSQNKNDTFSDLRKVITSYRSDKSQDNLLDVLDYSFSTSYENSQTKFYSEINRYRLYSNSRQTVDDLIYNMKTEGVLRAEEVDRHGMLKLKITFDNDVVALFIPMRVRREQEALPNQLYFDLYERHTSEIAAFHLDRILRFHRAMPVVGRKMNMITEMLRISNPALQRTFFVSPKPDENLCFTGTCDELCDSYHPICGNGTIIEGSLMAYFPEMEGAERTTRSHPWATPKSKGKKAAWETDRDYCDKVINLEMYAKGRLLLDLIDMSVFDFLMANGDRRSVQRFDIFGNDTFTVHYDHGRAFSRAFHDDLKILAPMLQCCFVRSSTLETLLSIHNYPTPLSQRMRESLAEDPIAPILWEPHLEALDRRLIIVLQAIRDCISRYPAEEVLVTRDAVDFS